MKSDVNPMSPALQTANSAPRCRARSKRTGEQCKGPAVSSWQVCRFHGAGGGHKAGPTHPSWKHGLRSQEAVRTRKLIGELIRETRELEALIG